MLTHTIPTTQPDAAPPGTPLVPEELLGNDIVLPSDSPGQSLNELLRQLRLSIRHVARVLRMSPTTTFSVITTGEWPRRFTPEMIQAHAAEMEKLLTRTGRVSRHAAREAVSRLLPESLRPEPAPPRRSPQAAPKPVKTPKTTTTESAQEDPPMLMAKQTLTPSARKAFGLFMNPFDGEVVDDSQMYVNGEIAYVREACMQAAVGGRFVAVVSESGGGKTTMLGDLEARIERDRKPVLVIKPWVLGMEESDTRGKTLKSADILASIITTLDPLARPRMTLQARSNQARDALVKSIEAGYNHLLVIEEAHSLPEPTLKHLKRLHEMRMGRKPLLGILLLGQTELAMKLDPRRASLREVTQRCEVVRLMPLDGDLKSYLEHRARAAGHDLSKFFDQSGIDELRSRLTISRPVAGGKSAVISLLYPLAVNNLVTAALNLAADLGAPVISRDVVKAV